MIINENIHKLRDRIKNFLQVNEKADLMDLKLHLECKETYLLLALGELVNEQHIILEKDGWKIIVNKKN